MAGQDFTQVLLLTAFLVAQWFAGRLLREIGLPGLLGEIAIGVAFGPYVGKVVPYELTAPLVLLGLIGVGFVIFESGMHLDFGKFREVWVVAVSIGLAGTILPLGLGLGFLVALGYPAYPEGLSAGFSLAPTSVGISLSLLASAKKLGTRYGQTIMGAAFTVGRGGEGGSVGVGGVGEAAKAFDRRWGCVFDRLGCSFIFLPLFSLFPLPSSLFPLPSSLFPLSLFPSALLSRTTSYPSSAWSCCRPWGRSTPTASRGRALTSPPYWFHSSPPFSLSSEEGSWLILLGRRSCTGCSTSLYWREKIPLARCS